MIKCVFISSTLLMLCGFWSSSTANPLCKCEIFVTGDAIRGTAITDTIISFKEYISRIHLLATQEIEHDYSLLNRLNLGKRSVLKDTSALIYLSRAFPLVSKQTGTIINNILPDSSSIDKYRPLLRQRIHILLWNDSVWQAMRPYTDSSFILINIAANRLSYIHKGTIEFSLRTITGKRSTPTPVLNSAVNAIIQFPYWNIPRRIAVNEMLPLIRNHTALLRTLHLEVLEKNKVVSNPELLPWKSFSSKSFPYSLRQLPGPWNALGLLKFEFVNPYRVYLHDTNNKADFQREVRYLSHGCIRLENPVKLAIRLNAKIDTAAWGGETNKLRPVTFLLTPAVKIFIIYATVGLGKEELKSFPDIYNKIKAGKFSEKSNQILSIRRESVICLKH